MEGHAWVLQSTDLGCPTRSSSHAFIGRLRVEPWNGVDPCYSLLPFPNLFITKWNQFLNLFHMPSLSPCALLLFLLLFFAFLSLKIIWSLYVLSLVNKIIITIKFEKIYNLFFIFLIVNNLIFYGWIQRTKNKLL